MKFRRAALIDRQGMGFEALHVLVPEGWRHDGAVRWRLDNPAQPASLALRTWHPGTGEAVEVFPDQGFFWSNQPGLTQMFPVGSRYFGAEVRPAPAPIEALKHLVFQRFRPGATQVKVVAEQRLPDLGQLMASPAAPGVQRFAEGALIRLEYLQNGQPMEEVIQGVLEAGGMSQPSLQGPVTLVNWSLHHVIGFQAPKGRLDGAMRLCQTVAGSLQLDLRWFNRYVQLVEQLLQAQIRQIQSIGELSRYISRTWDEISARSRQSYELQQTTQDRVMARYSDYQRGVTRYQGPDGRPVALPSHGQAWGNRLGEYLVSDSPGFNPNVGSTGSWVRLEPVR